MAANASVRIVVLFESELRAIAEAVRRLNTLERDGCADPEALVQAHWEIVQAAHVAFGGVAGDDGASWVLCVVNVTKPKDDAASQGGAE